MVSLRRVVSWHRFRLWTVCSHMVPVLERSVGSSGSYLVDLALMVCCYLLSVSD